MIVMTGGHRGGRGRRGGGRGGAGGTGSGTGEKRNWNDPSTNIFVLSGPVASGKTEIVYDCASSLGLHVIEINTSKPRDSDSIKKLVLEASQSKKVETHRQVIGGTDGVIDVDGVDATVQHGFSLILFDEVSQSTLSLSLSLSYSLTLTHYMFIHRLSSYSVRMRPMAVVMIVKARMAHVYPKQVL